MSKIKLIELSDLLSEKTDMHKPKKTGGGGKTNLQCKCEYLVKDKLPIGNGLNAGVEFDFFNSNSTEIIFVTSFHHKKNDSYDGWTDHKIIVIPTFGSYKISITGEDRNQIKDYLFDLFSEIFEL